MCGFLCGFRIICCLPFIFNTIHTLPPLNLNVLKHIFLFKMQFVVGLAVDSRHSTQLVF